MLVGPSSAAIFLAHEESGVGDVVLEKDNAVGFQRRFASTEKTREIGIFQIGCGPLDRNEVVLVSKYGMLHGIGDELAHGRSRQGAPCDVEHLGGTLHDVGG